MLATVATRSWASGCHRGKRLWRPRGVCFTNHWGVCWFARAALTKSLKMDGSTAGSVSSHSSGGWKFGIEVLAELAPSEAARGSVPGLPAGSWWFAAVLVTLDV